MSSIDDPRVQREGNGFTVTTGGIRYRVLLSSTFRWCIYTGAELEMVGAGYPTADAAIAELLNTG